MCVRVDRPTACIGVSHATLVHLATHLVTLLVIRLVYQGSLVHGRTPLPTQLPHCTGQAQWVETPHA